VLAPPAADVLEVVGHAPAFTCTSFEHETEIPAEACIMIDSPIRLERTSQLPPRLRREGSRAGLSLYPPYLTINCTT
jgi:hypothetical protein